jgi:hypothetical protein
VKRWPTLRRGDRGLGCGAHHADGPRRRWVREPLEGQPVDPHHGLGRRGFTLVLLGVLVAVVTMRGGSADPVTPGRVRGRGGCEAGVRGVDSGHRRSGFGHLLQDLSSGEEPGRGAPDRGHRAVEGPVGRPTTAEVATREALGGHVPAQRPCLFLFSSPPRPPNRKFRYFAGTPGSDHTFAFGDPAARPPRGRCRTPLAAPLGVRLSRRCRQLPRGLPAVRRFGPAAGQPVRGHRSELRCPDRGESQ